MYKGLIHPVVLFGAIDHYKRNKKTSTVGILLGKKIKNEFNITNFFPIPYYEQKNIFFYDSSYFFHMMDLYKKVDIKEEFLGFYGIKCGFFEELCRSFSHYTEDLIYLQLNIGDYENPISTYVYENEIKKIEYFILASEAEQVGVDHLLKTYYEDRSEKEMLIESLNLYEKNLENIIIAIDHMIKTETINGQLVSIFEDCLNEKNKITS